MGYLESLRQKVGHQALLCAGATVVVFNENGELLLNLRSDTKTWGLPGGALELGETLEEAAKRELLEETGLEAHDLSLLHVFSGKSMYFKYPNGDELYSVVCLFRAETYAGTLKIQDNESICLRFFSFSDLPPLESRAAVLIEWLRRSSPCS